MNRSAKAGGERANRSRPGRCGDARVEKYLRASVRTAPAEHDYGVDLCAGNRLHHGDVQPMCQEEAAMEVRELERRASELGLDYSIEAPKASVIRAIQRRRGQVVCFGNDERFSCASDDCEWRGDCLKPIAEWLR